MRMFYKHIVGLIEYSVPYLGPFDSITTQILSVPPSNVYTCFKFSRNACFLVGRPTSYSYSGHVRRTYKYVGVFGRSSLFRQQPVYCFHIASTPYCTNKKEKTGVNEVHATHRKSVQSESTLSEKEESSIKTDSKSVDELWDKEEKNVSIFQKFKKMYRDYWYILVPVHVITSLGWFGGFYYLAVSGVDIVALLECSGISSKLLDPLRDSSAGYIAVAYALYKIATPVRYMVTIGGTTISIKYLKEHGYIKPIPPKEKLKEMYQEKKDNLIEKRQNFTHGIKQKREQLKERRESFMRECRDRTKK